MKRFPPELWNIARFIGSTATECVDKLSLCTRTNNALERYNQTLGGLFTTRPTIPDFVEQIRNQAKSYLEDIDLIRTRSKDKPIHALLPAEIPEAYARYAVENREEVGESEPAAVEMLSLEQYSLMRSAAARASADAAGSDCGNSMNPVDVTLEKDYQEYLDELATNEEPIRIKKRERGRRAAPPKAAVKKKK